MRVTFSALSKRKMSVKRSLIADIFILAVTKMLKFINKKDHNYEADTAKVYSNSTIETLA